MYVVRGHPYKTSCHVSTSYLQNCTFTSLKGGSTHAFNSTHCHNKIGMNKKSCQIMPCKIVLIKGTSIKDVLSLNRFFYLLPLFPSYDITVTKIVTFLRPLLLLLPLPASDVFYGRPLTLRKQVKPGFHGEFSRPVISNKVFAD